MPPTLRDGAAERMRAGQDVDLLDRTVGLRENGALELPRDVGRLGAKTARVDLAEHKLRAPELRPLRALSPLGAVARALAPAATGASASAPSPTS